MNNLSDEEDDEFDEQSDQDEIGVQMQSKVFQGQNYFQQLT
jgi:hypothetical protein